MKIKYIWHDQPDVVKVYDTVKDFATMPYIFRRNLTQEEYDDFQRMNITRKKEEGLVLSYEIIEE